MTNYYFYSMRFVNLLSFRSISCRNLCTICRHKQNYIKSGFIYKRFQTEVAERNNYLSSFLLFKSNLKPFQPRNYFSTTQRSQRLDQIHKNGSKEKTPSKEAINEWQQLREMSLFKRFKVMFKKYWYISIPVHCVTSGLSFGLFYLIAQRYSD